MATTRVTAREVLRACEIFFSPIDEENCQDDTYRRVASLRVMRPGLVPGEYYHEVCLRTRRTYQQVSCGYNDRKRGYKPGRLYQMRPGDPEFLRPTSPIRQAGSREQAPAELTVR